MINLKQFFGFSNPSFSGSGHVNNQQPPSPTAAVPSPEVELGISKALRQIEFVAQSYRLKNVMPSQREDLVHDLEWMLANQDLTGISLEVLGPDNSIVSAFRVCFESGSAVPMMPIVGKGLELPLLSQRHIAKGRFVIHHRGQRARYGHKLRMPWNPAASLAKRAGADFSSNHIRKITAGHQQGTFHVSDDMRHQLEVIRSGPHFALAKDFDLQGECVYLPWEEAEPGLVFRPGMRVTAVVVQRINQFQARSIRPA
jgi:hypothetical protein